jgi:hypothetical protein
MSAKIECTWFICTISKESFKNWEICKEISAWGITASGHRKPKLDRVKKGDHLIIYAATKGFIATAIVTGPMSRPTSKEEAPWAGGVYRYGAIVPFKILVELDEPMKVPFHKMIIEGTEIHTGRLQKGFAMITGKDGNYLLNKISNSVNPISKKK